MIAAALHGVIAQRLVKRVCTDCAQPTTPTANEIAWLTACRPDLKAEDHRFVAGAGCTYCNLTGYRGRVAVYEILEIDRTLADAIRRGDLEGFGHAARSRVDYVPLAQGAIDFALSGITSLGEAMAVGSGLEEFVEVDEPAHRREAVVQLEGDAPLEDVGVEALLEQRV
jgi:MSHA biogenesis protein MshE